jgi:hypothetical protein
MVSARADPPKAGGHGWEWLMLMVGAFDIHYSAVRQSAVYFRVFPE